MRKTIFTNYRFFHLYNRGTDKRQIFMDKNDYYRFIRGLFEFNDVNPSDHFIRYIIKDKIGRGSTSTNWEKDRIVEVEKDHYQIPVLTAGRKNKLSKKIQKIREPRKLLVNILCFCLMPNHFHLLIEQIKDHGIIDFMQKLGTGYTMYFNEKYERSGHLFQGRFKAVPVVNESQLLHLSRYIHLNPAELKEPKWEEEGIKNRKAIKKFLEQYQWSSYADYIGKKNFPSVTNRKLINSYSKNPKEYKKFVNDWLTKDFEKIEDLILET